MSNNIILIKNHFHLKSECGLVYFRSELLSDGAYKLF